MGEILDYSKSMARLLTDGADQDDPDVIIHRNKIEEAEKCSDKSLEIDPDNIDALDTKMQILKKLGKDEYWSPNLVMSKKIESMDMETGVIEEEIQDDEPLTLINAQRKGHFS